jgi:anthranilate synthase component 1
VTEVVTDGQVVERHEATRWSSSPQYQQRFKVACGPACRAFAAGWPATSATTRCATSSRAWPHDQARWPGTPDILLLLTEEVAVIDNLSGRLYLIVWADPPRPDAYFKAKRACRELVDKLRYSVTRRRCGAARSHPVERDFAKADYLRAVLAPRTTSPPATACRW